MDPRFTLHNVNVTPLPKIQHLTVLPKKRLPGKRDPRELVITLRAARSRKVRRH